jgi:phosphatidylinositol alpha 1,6-mannosyltransferase
MRILYCTDTYPPQVNGVSVVTALSVRGLVRRGCTVHVIAPRYPEAMHAQIFEPAAGETVTTIPSAPMPGYRDIRVASPDARTIGRTLREFRPDLVHCATEFVIGRLGQRAAQRSGIPVVTSYHTDFGKYTEAYGVPWLRGTVTGYLTRFHQRAARTYTPGTPARDELLARGLHDVEVWGRGVATEVFTPARRDDTLRAALGAEGRTLFLHVGRLAAEKGVPLILEAYAKLRAELPPGSTRLVIAGAGPERAALEEQAGEDVTFLGYLQRDTELPRLYASADAFLFASTTETLGLVVLEAMSAGLPVVAAPEGGVRDHLRDGVNGLAYPAGDVDAMVHAMRRVVQDRALAAQLAQGARATAEALTWDAELDRLVASYREVLGAGG